MADALSALLAKTDLSDHDEVLRHANTALKKNKSDTHAQHVRLVALIKLDRHDEALHFLQDSGSALQEQAPLAHAYVLYKTGRARDALELAQRHGKTANDFQHMIAQAAYRAEEFGLARSAYRGMQAEGTDEEADVRVNRGAVDAQLCWTGDAAVVGAKKLQRADLEQFDSTFNVACEAAAKGEYKQAEVFLSRARDLCRATDLSDEEKDEELVPILLQMVYVLLRQGKWDEARRLSEGVDLSSITDVTARHITQSNLLVLSSNTTENPYQAQALFHATATALQRHHEKPFSYQSAVLDANAHTHSLATHKFPGVASSTLSTLKSAKDPLSPAALTAGAFNALAHAHLSPSSDTGSTKPALQRLKVSQSDTIGFALVIAQLHILAGNIAAATTLLETRLASAEPAIRHAPALVGLLVALYTAQSRSRPAKSILRDAAAHARETDRLDAGLLAAAGAALLSDADEDDVRSAHQIFRSLAEQYPEDPRAKAGLVASAPTLDGIDTASLPPIDKLTADAAIDADALEEAGVPVLSATAPAVARKRAAAVTPAGFNPDGTAKAQKKRRIRPLRMPKDFVEGKEMDAERWLPLRDRSGYRPNKKKKRGGAGAAQGGTQGGLGEAEKVVQTPGVQVAKKKKGKGKR